MRGSDPLDGREPPHPEPSLRSVSDLSPPGRGEGLKYVEAKWPEAEFIVALNLARAAAQAPVAVDDGDKDAQ